MHFWQEWTGRDGLDLMLLLRPLKLSINELKLSKRSLAPDYLAQHDLRHVTPIVVSFVYRITRRNEISTCLETLQPDRIELSP